MEQTWRWFGPDDSVSLDDIRQAGATGIVTALHQIPIGDVWPVDAILERKALIEDAPKDAVALRWTMVESVPVHDDIKAGAPGCERYIEAFCQSLRHLAACGIDRVCYNFMPVIDWTRTDLSYRLATGARALRFDADRFAAFDLFILKREGAEADFDADEIARAETVFAAMDDNEKTLLTQNIIAGLPGRMTDAHDLDGFNASLARFAGLDADDLRRNLFAFLDAVVPVAEELGVKLCIHPDDPPRPLLGLPRVVCTADDVRQILGHIDSIANGLTLCAGTFGVLADNDLPAMAHEFGPKIHFAHLRGTKRETENPLNFHEAEHLGSDIDMIAVIHNLLAEEERRRAEGRVDVSIPIRPDHGHQMLDDLGKSVNPGYSAIGRLKGLAEIRGVIATLSYE